jgi:hypothetical protein
MPWKCPAMQHAALAGVETPVACTPKVRRHLAPTSIALSFHACHYEALTECQHMGACRQKG